MGGCIANSNGLEIETDTGKRRITYTGFSPDERTPKMIERLISEGLQYGQLRTDLPPTVLFSDDPNHTAYLEIERRY